MIKKVTLKINNMLQKKYKNHVLILSEILLNFKSMCH